MPHKRDGFVPLGDIAGTVELPGDRALTPAAPEARHHFTQLDQVMQLVGASEADADVGFMARLLALCSLPRRNATGWKVSGAGNEGLSAGEMGGLGLEGGLATAAQPALYVPYREHREHRVAQKTR